MLRRRSILSVTIIVALYGVLLNSSIGRPASRADMREAVDQSGKAARVFDEIMDAPDSTISKDLLGRAECIAVFPSVIKAAFVFGGKGGKGVVSCRDHETRAWSAPIFLKIGGGSAGFQIGVEATDLVLLGMNSGTVETFKKSRFE